MLFQSRDFLFKLVLYCPSIVLQKYEMSIVENFLNFYFFFLKFLFFSKNQEFFWSWFFNHMLFFDICFSEILFSGLGSFVLQARHLFFPGQLRPWSLMLHQPDLSSYTCLYSLRASLFLTFRFLICFNILQFFIFAYLQLFESFNILIFVSLELLLSYISHIHTLEAVESPQFLIFRNSLSFRISWISYIVGIFHILNILNFKFSHFLTFWISWILKLSYFLTLWIS